MFHRKIMASQIELSGLRMGDSCRIYPFHGKKKAFTLNRHCIDFISPRFRPQNLSMSYFEIPSTQFDPFHYRLELDNTTSHGRFVLKTLQGQAFWVNGLVAKEAYVERMDRIMLDDNKINFDSLDLTEQHKNFFEHPILLEKNLLQSDLKILIQGETGTGKSHLASKIHRESGRIGSFVAVNLSSYNPQLIESELFGHKKGSFTGATCDKDGAFSEAQNGTLFLDEIDSLPLEIQTKLLTFIDNNKFRRVGETRETAIKTRLIFATGRPLEPLVEKGLFRRDFYFRLKSGHTLELKPLRNEVSQIAEACQFYSLKTGVNLTPRLLEFYETLAWPGNLRQLFGHLDKKKILSRSLKLDFDGNDEALLVQSSDLMDLKSSGELLSMQKMKEEYAKKALSMCEGNFSQAAKLLDLSEKTVRSIVAKA
jgi:transcriptional regulator with PAS, ATPase and Fis domain